MPNGFQPFLPEGLPTYVDPRQLAEQNQQNQQMIMGGLNAAGSAVGGMYDRYLDDRMLKDPQVQAYLSQTLGIRHVDANQTPSVTDLAGDVNNAAGIMYPNGQRSQGAPAAPPRSNIAPPSGMEPKPEPVPAPRYGFNEGGGFYQMDTPPAYDKPQSVKPDPENGKPVFTEEISVQGKPSAEGAQPTLSPEAARWASKNLAYITQQKIQNEAAAAKQTINNQNTDTKYRLAAIREGRRLAADARKEQMDVLKMQRAATKGKNAGQMTPALAQKMLSDAENRRQRYMATRARMVDSMAEQEDIDALDETIAQENDRIATLRTVVGHLTKRFADQQGIPQK